MPDPEPPEHGEDPAAFELLDSEIDNVVAALGWALAGGDVEGGARLAAAAAPWWVHAGRLGEARSWLERATLVTPPSDQAHRLSQHWLGWVLARQGDLGAARSILTAAATAAPDSEAGAASEVLLALVEIDAGDLDAGGGRLQALGRSPIVGATPQYEALVRYGLGRRSLLAGELPEASELLEAATLQLRDCGMWHSLAQALGALTQTESARRRFSRAEGAIGDAAGNGAQARAARCHARTARHRRHHRVSARRLGRGTRAAGGGTLGGAGAPATSTPS